MGTIGVVSAADQVADGTNPNQLATVDPAGNLSELNQFKDQFGITRGGKSDPSGGMQLASDGILTAMLIELKILNNNIATLVNGLSAVSDPDLDRADADVNDLLNPYNLS